MGVKEPGTGRAGPAMGRPGLDPGLGVDERMEVRHVCFECGGPLASGLILVTICWACQGVGTLSDHELTVALRLQVHRESIGLGN